MSVEGKVREHFHRDARRFDAIYETSKGPVARFIDNVWRGVVRRRLELTIETLEPLADKSILDVGCGSGRFCVAFAQHGARSVLGVDFAEGMIAVARRHAETLGIADRCEFRIGTFPEAVPESGFDASTALGFFDYIEDPLAVLQAMRTRTRETMVLSFPKAVEWRVPVRRLRFLMRGCPLFLYTESRVRDILRRASIDRYDWINLDRDYLVVAHLAR